MTVSGSISPVPPDLVRCFCCDQLVLASDIIRFEQHPQEGVCAPCAAWLNNGGQLVARKRVWRRHHRGRWRRE
jgi:hypothetical protein